MAAYNSLLAVLKLEKGPEFEGASKQLEDAKEKCLSKNQTGQRMPHPISERPKAHFGNLR